MAVAAAGYRHNRCGAISVLAVSQLRFVPPIVLTAVYAFLTIRFEDTSILDFLRYACAFFITKQQFYEWRYTPNEQER